MSHSRPLRLGAFGVGRMGQLHVENLVRLSLAGDIDLVALGDRYAPSLASACAWVGKLGGPELAENLAKFPSPGQMATKIPLDAVVVASRTEDHVQDSLAFTRHGIPVMVEKPFANSVAEAVECVKTLKETGDRLLQVAFQRYYDPATQAALDWASQGLIGELQQSQHVLQDKNPLPAGVRSCGITADLAIHLIFEAMSFHAFELPRYVQALRFMAPHYADLAGEGANVVHVFCSWSDDSLAHLWASRINNAGYDNGFKLMGTEGRIDVGEFVGDFGDVQAKLWRGTDDGPIARGTLTEDRRFAMTQPSPGHPDFYARFANAYARELDAFLEHLRNETPFKLGPEVGWKTLLVANVAEESSRLGGHRFELVLDKDTPISTVDDAAAFAASIGIP